MRIFPLLALLAFAAAPAGAQGIVIPVRCDRECPADGRLPRMGVDSVAVWATVERGTARTSVDHLFHNVLEGAVDAAFFFPLPADATLSSVSVYLDGELDQYNRWSGPDESRWIAEGIVRQRDVYGLAEPGLEEYAGMQLMHVPVHIPPHGTRRVQVVYTQPIRAENGTYNYRYPLSAGAGAASIGHLELGATVRTETGFRGLQSPHHAVRVEWGTEPGRCPPTAACGTMGVPSRRVKIVRLAPGPDDRARDFELVGTTAEPDGGRRGVSIP